MSETVRALSPTGRWVIVASGGSSLQAALCRASGSLSLRAASEDTQPGFWSIVASGGSREILSLIVVLQVVTRYVPVDDISPMSVAVRFDSLVAAGSGRNG